MGERTLHTFRGWGFPFRIANGRVHQAEGIDKIEANVRHLLSTRLGERTLLRTYGGGVHHRLQEPNDATLQALIRHEVEQALRRFLPGVRLTSPVRVSARDAELTVVVEYVADVGALARRLEVRLP